MTDYTHQAPIIHEATEKQQSEQSLSRSEQAERLSNLRDENNDASRAGQGLRLLDNQYVWLVIYCLGLVVASISWGFYLDIAEVKVTQKEQHLSTLKYRHLYIQADLIKHERFSSIQKRAQDFGLNLQLSEAPPYEVFVPDED